MKKKRERIKGERSKVNENVFLEIFFGISVILHLLTTEGSTGTSDFLLGVTPYFGVSLRSVRLRGRIFRDGTRKDEIENSQNFFLSGMSGRSVQLLVPLGLRFLDYCYFTTYRTSIWTSLEVPCTDPEGTSVVRRILKVTVHIECP